MSYKNRRPYQRAIQKYNVLDAGDREVFDSIQIDKQFADKNMRHKLNLARLGARKLAQNRSLELREKGLGQNQSRIDIRKDISGDMSDLNFEIDKYNRKQGKRGRNLAYGNVVLKAILGNQERERENEMAQRKRNIATKYFAKGLS